MRSTVLVVGAGPAGLMAAEAASETGAPVIVADRMPSPARKMLMAGKSGLNVSKREDPAAFRAAFGAAPLGSVLDAFGPDDVTAWMEGLGQDWFAGSTGRVFPTAMKASPLLRAWLARLAARGVGMRTRWRWTGWDGDALRFDTPEGLRTVRPAAVVLAVGGASWRRLGSDGAWAAFGLPVRPFAPANVGLDVPWSPHMAKHFGAAVKNAGLVVDGAVHRGEVAVTATGLEGGGLYPLSPRLREGAPLWLDMKPDLSEEAVAARLAARGKASVSNHLRKALRLSPVQVALVHELGGPSRLKRLPVPYAGTRPLDEAISVAGGLRWDALEGLMLRDRPGVFAAGEMLDWEAPTGGYLLTACLSTGRAAGLQAARWLGTIRRAP